MACHRDHGIAARAVRRTRGFITIQAGYKQLIVTAKGRNHKFIREHAYQPLVDAGYKARIVSSKDTSEGAMADIHVVGTLDGRIVMEQDVLQPERWKVRSDSSTRGNRGTYDYKEPKYKGTAKAAMVIAAVNAKEFELTADVTFERDAASSAQGLSIYKLLEGTVTQTIYTVPYPPTCHGDPASFTNTYPVAREDGDITIDATTDPIRYHAGASITSAAPLTDLPYTVCCLGAPSCENKTVTVNDQLHSWLLTGANGTFQGAMTDGTLQGSPPEYVHSRRCAGGRGCTREGNPRKSDRVG